MRTSRQNEILSIISQKEVDTQEQLVNELNARGYDATQATVSRDVKELGLIKTKGVTKKYKYAAAERIHAVASEKLLNLFRESVVSIRNANNLIVVKTLSGNASSAGMTVDQLNLPEIIGSIAGDDTLLIVADSNNDAQKVKKILEDILR